MTVLQIMSASDPDEVVLRTADTRLIRRILLGDGVVFYRWPVMPGISATTPDRRILSYHAQRIVNLNVGGRYRHIDVARQHHQNVAARRKFLSEHRHSESEVRSFVFGRACFYLHIGHHVSAVVCDAGDLLSIPAGVKHWFDMGVQPSFIAIRFFEHEDGWIADFTGDNISERFPDLNQLTA